MQEESQIQISEDCHLAQYEPAPEDRLAEKLDFLELEDNSEDEGVEDYHVGGYHPVHVGELISGRYLVIQKLGWGHFSTVWLCKDFKFGNYVAVKVQKSSPHYMEAAFDEVEILQRVGKELRPGESRADTHVVHLLNSFVYRTPYGSHFCMVFQILSCNLLEVIKRYGYQGIPMNHVREITKQTLLGLQYLHERCHVIHTDLKPENVLLCLTDAEIRTIVEKGQLSKALVQNKRLNEYRQTLGIVQPNANLAAPVQQPTPTAAQQKQNENMSEQLSGLTGKRRKNKKGKLRKQRRKLHERQNQRMDTQTDAEHTQRSMLSPGAGQKKQLEKGFKIKIADLGNGCWDHHHFSTEIQTRQYRSPEVLIGCSYDYSADIWSLGCMVFELVTGNLLFQPKKGPTWSKNEDHIAQILQLFGPWDQSFAMRGLKSKHYFDKNGCMKRIAALQPVSLVRLLVQKYKLRLNEAEGLADFLKFLLVAEPERRPTAAMGLQHPWLKAHTSEEYGDRLNDYEYEMVLPQAQLLQGSQFTRAYYRSDCEQAAEEDNCGVGMDSVDLAAMKSGRRFADIRTLDRSFTDLGYIGFSEGIVLEELDSQPNWQFA